MDRKEWSVVSVNRGGPKLSHIFFDDDLLLFGEASFSQAQVMEHTLAQFCGISDQVVNRGKSRIWFSPNTPNYLWHSISSEFHIPMTNDFGTYLGMPIHHGRKKGMFSYLVERTQCKLAG